MPEYTRLPSGLPQRVWPHKNNRTVIHNEIRPYREQQSATEGLVQLDHEPGEIDHGSNAYRVQVLRAAIRARSKWEQTYQDEGWC